MKRSKRPPTAEQVAEIRRRVEKRFQTARAVIGAGNMNDTKWCAVHEVLVRRQLKIKFVDDVVPRVVNLLLMQGANWVDSTSGPFEFRQIEWIEYHAPDASEVLIRLQSIGRLPVLECPGGFRLQAYGTGVIEREQTA